MSRVDTGGYPHTNLHGGGGRAAIAQGGCVEAVDISSAAKTVSADADGNPRGVILYIGGAGNLKVDAVDLGTATIPVAAGAQLALQVKKIYSLGDGTTATSIFAFHNHGESVIS